MDWQTKGEDYLENLPSREKTAFKDPDWDYHRGWNFPRQRLMRWLESKVGQHFDYVLHEYVHADWVPKEYRNLDKLSNYVETHTFFENGEVCFYSDYTWDGIGWRYVKKEGTKTFYLHPKTRILCLYTPPSRKKREKNLHDERAKTLRILGDYHQLYKENGIWYEVKGEIIPFAPSYFIRKRPDDPLLETTNSWYRSDSDLPAVKVTLKRQLSHKELIKHGLQNDPVQLDRCPSCGGIGKNCIHRMKKIWEKKYGA